MPMTKKVKEVIDLLEANGWHYIGTSGDHRKFIKPGMKRPVMVAGRLSSDVPIGTFKAIMREAGLK